MDPVSKASFGLNETLRILIPGYYSLALIYLYVASLDRSLLSFAESFPSIMIGLGLGFVFYSWNYPNKRRVYQSGSPAIISFSAQSRLLQPSNALSSN